MKLVLEGAAIVHRQSLFGRLDEKMFGTGKWEASGMRKASESIGSDNTFVSTKPVASIEEALQTTAPWRNSSKRYHMVFMIARSH
jgi:hypothetical protein